MYQNCIPKRAGTSDEDSVLFYIVFMCMIESEIDFNYQRMRFFVKHEVSYSTASPKAFCWY